MDLFGQENPTAQIANFCGVPERGRADSPGIPDFRKRSRHFLTVFVEVSKSCAAPSMDFPSANSKIIDARKIIRCSLF
jgi:hypothetical protein